MPLPFETGATSLRIYLTDKLTDVESYIFEKIILAASCVMSEE